MDMGIPEVSADGNNMVAAVRAIRTLFEDISKLLLTADALMRERGWESRASNTCMADLSKSIQSPQNWMPNVIFRYFRNKDAPEMLVAISVILDSHEQQARITEPLISGVVYEYTRGTEPANDWRYEYAGWHTWIQGAKDDGTPISVDPRATWPTDKVTAIRLTSFALALVEIIDSEKLRDAVIVPLDRIARRQA